MKMRIQKHTWQNLVLAGAVLGCASAARADVTLTPVEVSRLYAYTDSIQSDGAGGYLGVCSIVDAEWEVLTGPLAVPSAVADDDPIGPTTDGWTLDGVSSFAIAHSKMTDAGGWSTVDNSDNLELFVNNQATQDPGQTYGPEGWGYSVSYLLITYDTAPTGGNSVGDPMTVTLDLGFSGTLYAGDIYDEYFLDVGYALGTGLTDYDPVVADPANNPNPGVGQFDVYQSWRSTGFSYITPAHSDTLQFTGVIGDQFQVLIAVSSFAYSWWGYTWTDGPLDATVTATVPPPPPACATLLVQVDKHTVGSGNHPGSTKVGIADMEVCVFDKSEGSCVREDWGVSWQFYPDIFENCDYVACGTTDPEGSVSIQLLAGDYIVIGKYDPDGFPPDGSGNELYIGVSASDFQCAPDDDPETITMRKYLQVIEKADGKKVPAKYTRLTGSELLIIEPEYVLWDETEQLYPFVFDSAGDWGVTAGVSPPEGFVADHEALSEYVVSEVEAVQFVITEVGSDLVPTETTFQVTHKGQARTVRSKVGIRLTADYAASRGFDVARLRARGLIMEHPGDRGRGHGGGRGR
jgi:hypothetical protein